MDRQEVTFESRSESEASPSTDARLVERVCQGDVDAVHRFFDDHYPGIYRYLLWLTERPELAEDLTQETFIRAWRALDRFDPHLPLRPWLHQIARREFLRAVRSCHIPLSLEAIPEPAAQNEANWTEAVEVREAVRRLPREEREMVVLHYVQVRYYVPHGLQWAAPEQPDGPPKLVSRPAVDAGWAQRVLAAARRRDDQRPEAEIVAGLQPEPDLEFIYLIGTQKDRPIRRWVHITGGNSNVP